MYVNEMKTRTREWDEVVAIFFAELYQNINAFLDLSQIYMSVFHIQML